jgi:hypothetical protein
MVPGLLRTPAGICKVVIVRIDSMKPRLSVLISLFRGVILFANAAVKLSIPGRPASRECMLRMALRVRVLLQSFLSSSSVAPPEIVVTRSEGRDVDRGSFYKQGAKGIRMPRSSLEIGLRECWKDATGARAVEAGRREELGRYETLTRFEVANLLTAQDVGNCGLRVVPAHS